MGADFHNDFDPGADFSRYRTFAFVKGVDMGHSGVLNDPAVRERVRNFIAGALETRNLREVPADENYDLAVRFWVAKQDKSEVHTTWTPSLTGYYWGGYSPYWYGAWGSFYEEYVVENYVEGTLLIDLIDPKTKELVWRTYLRQKIEDRSKAYYEAKDHLYDAMSKFPPDEREKKTMQKERNRLEAKHPNAKMEPVK